MNSAASAAGAVSGVAWVQQSIEAASLAIELLAVVIIVLAIVYATLRYLTAARRRPAGEAQRRLSDTTVTSLGELRAIDSP